MSSEWFRTYAPVEERPGAGPGVRLVCFPHAGGAASAYVRLARLLAPGCQVLSVQYPGRHDRRHQAPVADIGLLADAVAEEVTRHVRGPYAFFGHSMGAVVAYETARRLHGHGAPVRLFLSGRGAPGDEPGVHDRIGTDAELLAVAAGLGGTAADLLDDPDVREMVLPALRADYRALGSYARTPGPRLHVPFTVLVGDRDPVVPVAEAAAWEAFTTAPTDCRVFAGAHFYLNDGPNLDAVARIVTAALAEPDRSPVDGGATQAGARARSVATGASGDGSEGSGSAWR
ncbi:thioesterase II family protein [Streptomyces longwoodensis]|uniref:thioesterase II family protein n=1 Tax=Streptomyces longwoodensis TaxID=68231 RepID=UPI0030E13766